MTETPWNLHLAKETVFSQSLRPNLPGADLETRNGKGPREGSGIPRVQAQEKGRETGTHQFWKCKEVGAPGLCGSRRDLPGA